MKYKDIHPKTLHELENMVKDLHIELGKVRFDLANNTLKDTSLVKKIKKNISRALTAISEKEEQSSN